MLSGSRFVFTAIIARRLSVTDFGQYAYGQWLADFTFLLCSLGATGAISRYVAEFRHEPGRLAAFVRYCRPIALGLPCLAAALIPVGAWLSGLKLEPGVLALLGLWTLTNGLWAVQTAALSGLQRFDLIFFANLLAAAIILAGALLMPVGEGPGRLFALMSLASVTAALVGLAATRHLADAEPAAVVPSQWRSMLTYAINVWLATLLWSLVWSRGEMPIVRAYLGDDGVAHYSAALTLMGGAIQGVMLATSGVAPQLTRYWGEGAHAQALALARKLMDMQLLICGLAAVLTSWFSVELMDIAFGASYRGQSGTLAVLSLGLLAMAVSCQNHLLQIATDARFTRDSTFVGLLVLLGSAAWLVSHSGLLGAAVARAGTMLLMALISLWFVHRRWGVVAYSRGNSFWAFFLVTISAALQSGMLELTLPARLGLASLIALLLVFAIRDADGRMQAGVLLLRFRHASRSLVAVVGRGR